ncbi:hypothetical protein, partial [Thiorhodococcus minor]|uniref:hypothetical protein n=1 Tax=Thiorhodococcus minor TaxID=57489 RepID=UPI001ADBA789
PHPIRHCARCTTATCKRSAKAAAPVSDDRNRRMPSEARLTMSRLRKRFFIPFVIALVAVSTTSAEEIRDFYAEPGLHPNAMDLAPKAMIMLK